MDVTQLLSSKTYTLKKESSLFNQGDCLDCFYLITKGKVDLIKHHANGETVDRTIDAGMTLGDIAFFTKTPINFQAKAREEVTLIAIDESAVDAFLMAFPQFVLQMLKRLSIVLKETNEQLEMAVGQTRQMEGFERKSSINIVEVEKYYQIEGTQKYPMLLPPDHDAFLYLKEATCPICDRVFQVNQIRSSKLVFDHSDRDLRRHYKNFDELWYQLWRCPSCGYTHFHNEFYKLTPTVKKQLYDSLPRKQNVIEQRLVKQDINQVIEDYFHLNKLIAFYNVDSIIKVRLWQSLAWLLDDVKDEQLAYKARRVLKVMIEDSWYNSRVITQVEDECKIGIKLALLCKEEGDFKQARKYLLTLSQLKNVPAPIRAIIQDEIQSIKEMTKSEG